MQVYRDQERVHVSDHELMHLNKRVRSRVMLFIAYSFHPILLIASCVKTHNLQSKESRIQNSTYGSCT